ncbi:hypothetical protein RT761_00866 [Atribacter laminatus]|uniref:Uncharacterized protein n=1 Tax=Atribacter laminatus TaxID=2847778 RepID=A0A7T1AKM3_ATRLM|nr:hypothetical protein RT761_00866 [Atribacter laminatus]
MLKILSLEQYEVMNYISSLAKIGRKIVNRENFRIKTLNGITHFSVITKIEFSKNTSQINILSSLLIITNEKSVGNIIIAKESEKLKG